MSAQLAKVGPETHYDQLEGPLKWVLVAAI